MEDDVRLTSRTDVVLASYGGAEWRNVDRVIEHRQFVVVLLADRVDVFRFTGHATFERWTAPS